MRADRAVTLQLRLRVWIVIGDAGTTMGFDHVEIHQERRHRLRPHAGAAISVQRQGPRREALLVYRQGGTFLASVTSQVPDIKPRDRIQTTAYSDAGLVAALKATSGPVLIVSGVASEIVVQRTARDALAAGYAAHIAVDACGGVDARTEEAAWACQAKSPLNK